MQPTLQTLALIAERLEVELLDLMTFPAESDRHRLIDLTRRMKAATLKRMLREADVG